jgi:hypothetical protein
LQKDQQKKQAVSGIRGLFQKLMDRRQQPQTTPEQRQEMGREVLSRAPISPPAPTNIAQIKDMVDLERAVTAARQKYEYHVTPEGVVAVNKNDPNDAHLLRDSQGNVFKGKNMPKEGQLYTVNGVPQGVFHQGAPVLPGDTGWTEHDATLLSGGLESLKEKQLLRVDPIIAAEVGDPPLPSDFKGGRSSEEYRDALKTWGDAAWKKQIEKETAGGVARAQAWNSYRPVQITDYDPGSDSYHTYYTTASDAIARGAAGAAEGDKLASKQARLKDIAFSSTQMRDAINALDKPFSSYQIAQMTLALQQRDPTVARNIISGLSAQAMSEKQQNFFIWMTNMTERSMALSSLAQMGQGSDLLRGAIANTIPTFASGNKGMMIKKMDAFDNQLGIIREGIAKPGKPGTPAPDSGATADTVVVRAPNGQEKTVPKGDAKKYTDAGATIVQPKKK